MFLLILSGCASQFDHANTVKGREAYSVFYEAADLLKQGEGLFNAKKYRESEKKLSNGLDKMKQANTLCKQSSDCRLNVSQNQHNMQQVHYMRGTARLKLKNYDGALQDANEIAKDDPAGVYFIGEIYIKKGEISKAEQQITKLENLGKIELKDKLWRLLTRHKIQEVKTD